MTRKIIITGQFPGRKVGALRAALREKGYTVPKQRWRSDLDAVVVGRNPGKAAEKARESGVPVLDLADLNRLLDGEAWENVIPEGDPDALAGLRELIYQGPSGETWVSLMDKLDTCPPEQRELAVDYIEAHTAGWPMHLFLPRSDSGRLKQSLMPNPLDNACVLNWPLKRIKAMVEHPKRPDWRLLRSFSWPTAPATRLIARRLRFDNLEELTASEGDGLLLWALKRSRLGALRRLQLTATLSNAIQVLDVLAEKANLNALGLTIRKDPGHLNAPLERMIDAMAHQRLMALHVGSDRVSGPLLLAMVESQPRLRAFGVNGGQFDPDGLAQLLDAFDGEQLEHLRLWRKKVHHPVARVFQAQHLSALVSLSTSGLLSAEAWEAMGRATHLGRLRHLQLSATWMGDSEARKLARFPHLNRLVGLTLNSSSLTAVGLDALLSRAESLQWLDVGNTQIDDMALDTIAMAPCAPKLRYICVSGCLRTTGEGLTRLLRSKRLSSLQVLVVEPSRIKHLPEVERGGVRVRFG